MNANALRPLLLSPWLFGFGVLAQALALCAITQLGHVGAMRDGSLLWPVAWAMVALLWWLLHGPRLCNSADKLLRLRAPGVARTLAPAVALHLGLSVMLPWACLLVGAPASDSLQLGAALWLGAALGALMLSLPIFLGFVPAMLAGYGWPMLADPVASAAAGAVIWLVAAGLWFTHARRPRGRDWMPAGATFEGLGASARHDAARGTPQPSAGRCQDQRRLDNLAAVLGRDYQTLRQIFGRRRCALFYAWLVATCGFVLWLDPSYDNGFLFAGPIFCLVFVPLQAPKALARLHNQRRACWADLQLLAGLPPAEQLQAAVMRQVRLTIAERCLAMAALALCMGADRIAQDGRWALFVIGFSLLVWGCGQGLARLAWRGTLGSVALNVINAVMMLAGIITCVLWVA
ncbi:hypothetical protein CCOS865_01945 [Pseudomonas reidholzensis]|uniref:Transmembrane protein n=1 Tax=Pseudomonas reidholzensis TaxID=1785162 RepID=A0A383RRK5_9PSED|nr:hypothetical protein [Pseudomonas reidholzensis]SYX89687.1 hypothetical protein CCOS865_01945 [Pseudomonas reidholzensis]